MHVALVTVPVKSEHIQDFAAATRCNHEASIREPGNRRSDVLQLADDPARFVRYQVYAGAPDADAYKATVQYRRWRDDVAPGMAVLRTGVSYRARWPQP